MGVTAAVVAGTVAVAATGAQVAAGLMADGDKPGQTFTESTGSDTSPGLKVAEFQNLLNMGVFDPTPLMQASPLNQLMGEVMATSNFAPGAKKMFLQNARLAVEWYEAGQPTRKQGSRLVDRKGNFRGKDIDVLQNMLDRMMGLSGYSNLDDLIAAENAFQEQIKPLLASARGAAAGNFKSKLDAQAQIVNILGNLPDASAGGIAKLRASEKSRLLRDLNMNVDDQRGDLLELANAGNFNPGRPLGDLEEFRANATQDADLDALGRALALIGGQQSVAGANLGLLYQGSNQDFNQASTLAAADQGLRTGGQIQTPTIAANNGLANALSAAGATAANAGTSYAEYLGTRP